MDPYVNYEFYEREWGGSQIKEAAFSQFAIKATYEIDRITFGRVKDITDEVKFATCAVIDEMAKLERSGAAGKKAESVGNYSVTYDEAVQQNPQRVYKKAAYPYLINTGLLYRGVMI